MQKLRWACWIYLLVLVIALVGCKHHPSSAIGPARAPLGFPSIVILGNTQDAGSPQIGCNKVCCKDLFDHPDPHRKVVCLGLVDPKQQKKWLIEATPDLPAQMRMLHDRTSYAQEVPDGIFLTHAHIGHYTGLMHLGREAMNANAVPLYAMPRMKAFLETNGPWSQLVSLHNISLNVLHDREAVQLGEQLSIMPLSVPHRDEFSETVGYQITGPRKKALFIPDIDKWEKWNVRIEDAIAAVDYALLDATFFDGDELPGRDISEVPHPFVVESMARFKALPHSEKNKIYFIHFNHTNPLLIEEGDKAKELEAEGYHLARMGMVLEL